MRTPRQVARHDGVLGCSGGVVRPLAADDQEEWRVLWNEYNAFYERVVSDQVTQSTWTRLLDGCEAMHALVFESDGVVVGLVHYLFHPSTSSICPNCYLQDLFAAPAMRGRGVGAALIDAVRRAAETRGSSSVYWLTHVTNSNAKRLYDRVAQRTGFEHYRLAVGAREERR